jgi:hypothetical protein
MTRIAFLILTLALAQNAWAAGPPPMPDGGTSALLVLAGLGAVVCLRKFRKP